MRTKAGICSQDKMVMKSYAKKCSAVKPRTPQELGRLLNRTRSSGRVTKSRKTPFVKGVVAKDLPVEQTSNKTRLRKLNLTKKATNGSSSKRTKKLPKSQEVEDESSGVDEDDSLSSNNEDEESAQEVENNEVDKEENGDLDSEETEEGNDFSVFESSQGTFEPVLFRQVATKVFEAKFQQTSSLFLQGKLTVTLLEGDASVLGWPLTIGKAESIFSSKGASFLGVNARKGAVLRLNHLETTLDKTLRRLHPTDLFGGAKERLSVRGPAATARQLLERSLDCKLITTTAGEKVIVVDQQWKSHLEHLSLVAKHGDFRSVICGGKGLGKSTFMRMLINKILSQQEQGKQKVIIVDLDPGQSEFTAPGCLSVVEVSEPLLGPSFTHLKTPLRSMFLGQVDVTRCLGQYYSAAQELIHHCSALSDVPVIVNTMGFNSGVGVKIMHNIMQWLLEVGPANVVELRSRSAKRNYPDGTFQLSSECRLMQLQTQAENVSQKAIQSQWGMPPSEHREICVISYFSPIVHLPNYSLLPEPPFVIRLGYLVLGVVNEYINPNLILRAVVGNLVALCKIDDDHPNILKARNGNSLTTPRVVKKPPALPCFGYGVVSGIDKGAGQLYLQTPEDKSLLRQVNCLLLGTVQVPPVLRTTGASGFVPFFSTGNLPTTSAPVRAKYRPISSLVAKSN